MSSRRRSSLVAVHADKGQQEGAVPIQGFIILIVVLAAIAGVWINEFIPSDDDYGETSVYRTGGGHHGGGGRKIHYAVPQVGSLKDCEKVVTDALKDYVEKQAAVADLDDDDEDEKPKKGKGKKSKKDDDSEEEVKPKKDAKKKSKK